MSSHGRCQEALYDLLWESTNGYGPADAGLLHDLGFARVSALIEPIIDAVYPIAHEQGRATERASIAGR